MTLDANGNLVIKKARKDSILTSFPYPDTLCNENDNQGAQSDYENPYPEMMSTRKIELNRTWSCTCLRTHKEEENINTEIINENAATCGYESDEENAKNEEEKETNTKKVASKNKGKKSNTTKNKGKQGAASNKTKTTEKQNIQPATNYSSYKASAPSGARGSLKNATVSLSNQSSDKKSSINTGNEIINSPNPSIATTIPSSSKRKFMAVIPSVPELARAEPEFLKERIVLVKDMKTSEYCKNKIMLKIVGLDEISVAQNNVKSQNTPTKPVLVTPIKSTSLMKPNDEEIKIASPAENNNITTSIASIDIQPILREEIIEKMLNSINSDNPLQIDTNNEELVKWIENPNKSNESFYWCKICDQMLNCENANSHSESKEHNEIKDKITENDMFLNSLMKINIVLASDNSANEFLSEKAKLLKKKAKKIKQSLEVKSMSHESTTHPGKELSNSINKQRIQRLCLDLEKQVNPHIKDYDLVENTMKEILKIIDQHIDADLQLLRHMRCIHLLVEICKRVFCCPKGELKSLGKIIEMVMKILSGFTTLRENRIYLLVTNKLIVLVELLMWCLMNINVKFVVGIPFLPTLFQILTVHIKQKVEHEQLKYKDAFIQYIYCYGVLNKLKTRVFQVVNGPLDLTDAKNVVPSLLLSCVMFLESLTLYTCIEPRLSRAVFEKPHKAAEDAQFVIQQTELYGVIPLLSRILLAKGPLKETSLGSVILPYTIQTLALMSVKILNNCCRTDLVTVQTILKMPYYSEQIYHLLNYLLQYSNENVGSSEEVKELLHETIVLCGYIALIDPELQALFCKGGNTLMQKLIGLPIAYFQDKKMKDILYPTLITLIHNNERNYAIMSQEIATEQIAEYIKNWMNSKEEENMQDNLSLSGTSSAFDMLLGNSPFICFSKRVPKSIWEQVYTMCAPKA